jgi:hypothetical protein
MAYPLRAVELDSRANNHVQSELEWTNQLGRLVISSVDLTGGTVYAIVPEPHIGDLYRFREAVFPLDDNAERTAIPGGYVMPVQHTEADVAVWAQSVLAGDAAHVLVCESWVLRAPDVGHPALLPRRTVTSGEFVYHWATRGDDENVANVVNAIYPVPLGVGVIAKLPVPPAQLLGGATISPADLSLVARNTHCILLGAYDGESVLVWMSKTAPFQLSLPVE